MRAFFLIKNLYAELLCKKRLVSARGSISPYASARLPKKTIFGTITSIAKFCQVIAYLKDDEINISVYVRCSPLSKQAPGSHLKMIYRTKKDIKCVHNDLSDGSLHVCQFITIIMKYCIYIGRSFQTYSCLVLVDFAEQKKNGID